MATEEHTTVAEARGDPEPRGDPGAGDAAVALRRGVISLARRLRTERAERTERPERTDGGGLTMLELSVLGQLRRRGPTTPGELADAEQLRPQSLTRTLASLEARRFTSRSADPADGRRSLLAITDDGLSALAADMQRRDSWLAEVMAENLTHAERELLRLAGELMERLLDARP
jgi:DNA-binding MarR family transcriptional regulator